MAVPTLISSTCGSMTPTRRIKTYRADRFESASATDERFAPPPEFDATDFVRATAAADGRARVRAYRGAEKETTLGFADARAFAAHLIVEGGAEFEALKPAELRAAVRALAEGAAARHGAPRT